MKLCFAIYDRKAQGFTQPGIMLFENIALAKRSVQYAAQNKQLGQLVDRYPEDFELWQLCEFDELTGDVKADKGHICAIADLLEVKDNG